MASGRYLGLETITALGAPHECVALEYAENAKLYLPVENIELLSRYGHEEGLLDRLGGGAWQAKKAKLKERIREIAERLMRVAAERAAAPRADPRGARTRSGRPSPRASPIRKPTTSCPRSPMWWRIWRRAARWTG